MAQIPLEEGPSVLGEIGHPTALSHVEIVSAAKERQLYATSRGSRITEKIATAACD
jgi:hypothetical protein